MLSAVMRAKVGRVSPLTRRMTWCVTRPWALALLCPLGFVVLGPAAVAKGRFNDTGQTVCIDAVSNAPIECLGSAQDGESGRDVSDPDPKNGAVGFSFVKIAADGTELPRNAEQWACVKDRVSGLIWEVKTNDGGLRDMDNTYTNRGNGREGDASAFVQSVNAAGLCGHSDWRLPSRMELQGLVYYGKSDPKPAIDSAWFHDTYGWRYWSGSGYAGNAALAWMVDFGDGHVYVDKRFDSYYSVRLVRGML